MFSRLSNGEERMDSIRREMIESCDLDFTVCVLLQIITQILQCAVFSNISPRFYSRRSFANHHLDFIVCNLLQIITQILQSAIFGKLSPSNKRDLLQVPKNDQSGRGLTGYRQGKPLYNFLQIITQILQCDCAVFSSISPRF